MLKWFRKWQHNLFFVPAITRTVTMAEGEWAKKEAEQRFWKEEKYQNEKGETDVVS